MKGRFELIHDEPAIILDGAHNPEGMKNLCETVQELYPTKRHVFMVSVLKDKEYSEMFKYLKVVADEVHLQPLIIHGHNREKISLRVIAV